MPSALAALIEIDRAASPVMKRMGGKRMRLDARVKQQHRDLALNSVQNQVADRMAT
jgi:hypothetical protein